MCFDGKIQDYLVHRLIAITFLDNPDNLPTVNHKDGNPKNNCLANLEWMSQGENNKHSFQVLHKLPVGGKSVIMLDDKNQVVQSFPTQAAASIFLVGNSSLRGPIGRACKNGKKYHNYYWQYQ